MTAAAARSAAPAAAPANPSPANPPYTNPPPVDPRLDGARGDLVEAAQALWPRATVTVDAKRTWRRVRSPRPAGAPATSSYLVVPSLARPRTLLPLAAPKAAAAAVGRSDENQSRATRLKRRLLAAGLTTGVASRGLRGRLLVAPAEGHAESIEAFLSSLLGRDVVVTVSVGTLRANRKYVLQVLTPDGETLAFAKLARTQLTDQLVRREAAALRELAPRLAAPQAGGRLVVPRVIFEGQWGGRALLVRSALVPAGPRRRPKPPVQAMAQLARAFGTSMMPLGAGGFLSGLRSRAVRLATEAVRICDSLDAVEAAFGAQPTVFGSWHGDWTSWNTAVSGGLAHVWDWERFGPGVPVGLDLVHYLVQGALRDSVESWQNAVATSLPRLPTLLPSVGVEPGQARLLTAAYLSALSVRYLGEADADAGARLGAIGRSVLGELDALVGRARAAHPHGRSTGGSI